MLRCGRITYSITGEEDPTECMLNVLGSNDPNRPVSLSTSDHDFK
jgi:hypothetical protein